MRAWLEPAGEYIAHWLEYQLRQHAQPGCVIALADEGRVVFEAALGAADLARGIRLTPRHRFRVASHSKSFTAAAVMLLRERKRLKLEDRVGRYVAGLHPAVARATLAQLLSHSAGLVRDGADSGQFLDRRPFLDAAELRAELARPPVLRANTRFKYSNHGYGLLGLAIEAVTGERWLSWARRELIEAAGLDETVPDAPLPRSMPFARGHSARLPVGRRLVIPGDASTRALAPAAGFVSTARDLVRYFAQLSPGAKHSFLSAASRREMIRRRWRDAHSSIERYYGLGIISGSLGGWDWFGHSGGFQGYITRTCVLPRQRLALSVLTNAIDGLAHFWMDGAIQVLRAFAENGPPARRLRDWSGRWCTLWNAVDLVPMGGKVLVAMPGLFNPFLDASEIAVRGRDRGRIALAGGYASHGEGARLLRDHRNAVREVWLGGSRLLREGRVANEMERKYL
jgi:CubicO group peptidase (beta-lactamase class C family)